LLHAYIKKNNISYLQQQGKMGKGLVKVSGAALKNTVQSNNKNKYTYHTS